MCAIFGVVGINDLGLVKKMSKVQEFRGPDKQNFFSDPKFNLCIGMICLLIECSFHFALASKVI